MQQVLVTHKGGYLLGGLEGAKNLLLKRHGQVGVGLHGRRLRLLALQGDAVYRTQPDGRNGQGAHQGDDQVQPQPGALACQRGQGVYPLGQWMRGRVGR